MVNGMTKYEIEAAARWRLWWSRGHAATPAQFPDEWARLLETVKAERDELDAEIDAAIDADRDAEDRALQLRADRHQEEGRR